MAPLTFADTHNMIAYLTKSDASEGFDQIVDFLNAHIIQKKVVITEDTIRQALRLDDAAGVECLPNDEILAELARLSTFVLTVMLLTPVQPQVQDAVDGDADDEDNNEKVAHLEQDKVAQALDQAEGGCIQRGGGIVELDNDEDVTLVDVDIVVEMDVDTQERMEEDDTAVKEVNAVEPTVFNDEEVTMTMAQTLIKMKAEKAKILDEKMAKRQHDEEVEQPTARERQEQDDFKRAQELQQEYDQKQENIDSNVVAEQMQENHLDNIRKKNKVQTFLKPDRDEEPAKKRGAEETLLQESFKKLIAEVKALSSHTTQDTPTVDPAEISEEDVQNMLQIVPVAKFKVESVQVKVGGITEAYQSFKDMLKSFNKEDLDALWRLVKEKFSKAIPTVDREKALWVEIKRLYEPNATDVFWKLQRYMHDPLSWKLYTNCAVHQVTSTRRHHIFMLTEKDYPLTDVVLLLMLSAKLQVDEDCEIARDLVMKIFLKANQPKSKSLDTSSK
nr:leucine-rich repeat protein [Tanacetum cinerariifolium]